MRKFWWLALACAACASTRKNEGTHIGDVRFIDANGQPAGDAAVYAVSEGILIVANLPGLPGREHGFHIHAVGECQPPTFDSAGPHLNPTSKQHGRLNPAGPHLGDMPNVERSTATVTVRDLQPTGAAGLFDTNGAALVVHAQADDLRTDPSGNSGARIRCGVITPRT